MMMSPAEFLLHQVVAYGVLYWGTFIGMTLLTGRFLGWPGILLAHLVIALIVFHLDYNWVQSEMARPDWDGTPDIDAALFGGSILRTIMVNTLLLPIAVLVCRLGQRVSNRPRTLAQL